MSWRVSAVGCFLKEEDRIWRTKETHFKFYSEDIHCSDQYGCPGLEEGIILK